MAGQRVMRVRRRCFKNHRQDTYDGPGTRCCHEKSCRNHAPRRETSKFSFPGFHSQCNLRRPQVCDTLLEYAVTSVMGLATCRYRLSVAETKPADKTRSRDRVLRDAHHPSLISLNIDLPVAKTCTKRALHTDAAATCTTKEPIRSQNTYIHRRGTAQPQAQACPRFKTTM